MSYSQNNEEQIIADYFGGYIGNLISVGENSGTFLSNCLALIEKGWGGCLVEPSPKAFKQLKELHKDRLNVHCYELAIGHENGKDWLYESGEHLGAGDVGLLSTLDPAEIERWSGTTEFNQILVEVSDFSSFLKLCPYKAFEFISVDAEGRDLSIIEQIDFPELQTRLVCVEFNGKDIEKYQAMMEPQGFKIIHINAENIIFAI